MRIRAVAFLAVAFALGHAGALAAQPLPRQPGAGLLYYAKANSATNTSVIANTNLVGAFFQVIWSQVEKQDGVCDWSAVDSWLQPWLAAGRKVAIRIMWSTSGNWPKPWRRGESRAGFVPNLCCSGEWGPGLFSAGRSPFSRWSSWCLRSGRTPLECSHLPPRQSSELRVSLL